MNETLLFNYFIFTAEFNDICTGSDIITIGNACVLKPSEFSVATSNLFTELIPNYLDKVILYMFQPICETAHFMNGTT